MGLTGGRRSIGSAGVRQRTRTRGRRCQRTIIDGKAIAEALRRQVAVEVHV